MGWMCQAGQVPSAIEQSSQPATKWRKVKIQKKTNKFPSDNLNLIFSTHWWCVLNRPAISINKTGSANFLSVIHWPGGWLQSLPADCRAPTLARWGFAQFCTAVHLFQLYLQHLATTTFDQYSHFYSQMYGAGGSPVRKYSKKKTTCFYCFPYNY